MSGEIPAHSPESIEHAIHYALKAAEFAHHQHELELLHHDSAWSTWYAQYLLELSAVSDLLAEHLSINELSQRLGQLSAMYPGDRWASQYAHDLAALVTSAHSHKYHEKN